MIERLFNSTFTASRKVISKDSGGAASSGKNAYLTAAPCYLRALSGSERYELAKREVEGEYRLYCSADHDIRESDIITIGTSDYKVEFVAPRSAGG